MQEILEQVIDYLKGIWIKRRYIIVSTWMICPIGWLVVAQMPNVYESDARFYADTQSILRPLLKGLTVQTNPETQVKLMVRTLISRPNLERISRMTDLDLQAETPKQYENIISRLREGIQIKKSGGRREENIFTISFTDQDPEMARNIVQSALTVFIENTLGNSRTDSDSAQKFLNTQIKEYEDRLLASEAKLTGFKQKYSNMLPNQYGGYYIKLNETKEQLKFVELNLLETRTQLKAARSQLNSATNSTDSSNSNIKNNNSIQTSYDGRISELELSLDSLQLKYTDKHPDVIEVSRRLAYLNKQRETEIADYLGATLPEGSNTMINSQNPVIQQLQMQVNQLESQAASVEVRANDYRKQLSVLSSKIYVLPEVEAELVALNRGYEITKGKYEELLDRKETAFLGQQANDSTSKINFKIIEPPRAATKPSGPKRNLFFIIVTFLGLGTGVGMSLLMSQINPIVTSSHQVSKATGIPVFGMVSASENLGLHAWHKKKTLLFIVSNLFLISILIMLLTYSLYPEFAQAQFRRILP
jgi:polysaccharide chain length determinant protein (PEP-CTERM system associated)